MSSFTSGTQATLQATTVDTEIASRTTTIVPISTTDGQISRQTTRSHEKSFKEVISDIIVLSKGPARPYGNKYGSSVDRKTQNVFKRTGILKDLKALFPKHIWESIITIFEVVKQKHSGSYMDDRTYLVDSRSFKIDEC